MSLLRDCPDSETHAASRDPVRPSRKFRNRNAAAAPGNPGHDGLPPPSQDHEVTGQENEEPVNQDHQAQRDQRQSQIGSPLSRNVRGNKPKSQTKRGKYISKACNECKRRKSKCNGQRPCERCVKYALECVYPISTSSLKTNASSHAIRSLSEQVAQLQGNLLELRRASHAPVDNPQSSRDANIEQPITISDNESLNDLICPNNQADVVEGTIHAHITPPSIITPNAVGQSRQPTVNYTFNLELARQHLRQLGTKNGDADSDDVNRNFKSTRHESQTALNSRNFNASSIDPLWLVDKREALRLCHVYEEEIGISYPFLALDELLDNACRLYDAMEQGSRSGFAFASLPGPPVIERDDLDILRLALAAALNIETSGASDLSNSLYAKAKENTASKIWEPTTLKSIALFTLMANHCFLSGDDLQAWRLIGIPARWCLELGLHQSATLDVKYKSPPQRKAAVRLFWSVHTLDRRWSFGAGLPFVIQSNDIDTNIPMPDDGVPYLQAMVAYNRIGNKVWATLYHSNKTTVAPLADEVDFLHYSIDRWYRDIPPELKLDSDPASTRLTRPGRGVQRLQMLLYLRACQMKILLHQPALHSAAKPTPGRSQVRMLVDIAKDMIQKLDNLNKTTDIYQTQQVCFNHFLVSALGVVLLAVALEPSVYRSIVRDEFNAALDLVRGFSERSYVSRRLWRMIRGLRQAGVKLGISTQQVEPGEGQSNIQPGRVSPVRANNAPSPLVHAFPNIPNDSSQVDEPWLNNGITRDMGEGFMMPISGTEMTVTLSDLLSAMGNDNWATGLESNTSHDLVLGELDKGIENDGFDHGIDLSRVDFSQILDGLL